MGDDEEPFGTTAIPTGRMSIAFDESKLKECMEQNAQQPQTQAIAVYEASKTDDLDPLILLNGNLIDVNPHFVVYTVKNGLIRVMHRNSAMRALLRGHHNQIVTDIQFFHDGDVLGTVGYSTKEQKSTLIVWRVYEKSPEIGSERLLEISTNAGCGGSPDLTLSRLIWHPFNPNQFWMTHSTATNKQVATLVETTRIQTKLVPTPKDPKAKQQQQQQQQEHAMCQWHSEYCVMDHALQLKEDSIAGDTNDDGQLVDLCWSGKDARHVLSVHKNGRIILWDLKGQDQEDAKTSGEGDSSIVVPRRLFSLPKEDGVEYSRCLFLPHEQAAGGNPIEDSTPITTCFATASRKNSTVTLWSAFAQTTRSDNAYGPPVPIVPTKLQEISFGVASAKPSSFVLDVCYGPADLNGAPPSSFLVLGSRDTGRLYALHIQAKWSETKTPLCVGMDYMVPFALKHPVYSWSVICGPSQDDPGAVNEASGCGFDMKAFAYQSKAVQQLTITSSMSLPPTKDNSKSGKYQVQPLFEISAQEPAKESNTEPQYDEEEYDIEDEDDSKEQHDPEATIEKPTPPTPTLPSGGGGIFPGAANPFANWLGAIAGGNAPEPTLPADDALENSDKEIPIPPAPSDLPMPPGISAPAIDHVPVETEESSFLNPLELLTKSMNEKTAVSAHVTSSNGNKKSNNKSRSNSNKQSPRRSRSPKQRSQSNRKGNKSSNSDANKTPFPDGKVTILKRAPDATNATPATVPPPLPADPSVLSDPALMAAAGIPIPSSVASGTIESMDASKLEAHVQAAVEAAMSDLLVPAVTKAVHESFSSLARPLHNSMESLSKNGVSIDKNDLRNALDVETPLKAVFADTLRNVLIPSLQSITGQVLQQVQTSMPKPPPPQPPSPDPTKALAALAQQLAAMTSKMDALTAEVHGLRKSVAEQAAAAASAAKTAASNHQKVMGQNQPSSADPNGSILQIRSEIDNFLSKGKFEDAFTKAVATPTPQLSVYCCARSNLETVLRGPTPALSQPILICLMQQLSAALAGTQSVQELKIELAWLQEIALSLNPSDPSIAQHVPKVVGGLVSNVNARMNSEGNSPFRRPLQMLLQSLRGMQLG